MCGGTNKSSPTLNHHPNLYISRPVDPQFTRGVPHHPWALLVQVFWFSLRLFSSPSGRYPFMPSGGEGIFLFFLFFLALSLGLYTSLLWLSGLYLQELLTSPSCTLQRGRPSLTSSHHSPFGHWVFSSTYTPKKKKKKTSCWSLTLPCLRQSLYINGSVTGVPLFSQGSQPGWVITPSPTHSLTLPIPGSPTPPGYYHVLTRGHVLPDHATTQATPRRSST